MDIKIDSLFYRNIYVEFFEEPISHQIYTVFDNQPLYFGINNTLYHEDMKKFIDFKLDQIHIFKEEQALLKYFDNSGFRDAILLHRRRIIKVYLSSYWTLDNMIIDAAEVIHKINEDEKMKAISLSN